MPPPTIPFGNKDQLWTFGNSSPSGFPSPFQEIFFSSLDNFGAGFDFATSNAFLGSEFLPNSAGVSIDPRSNSVANQTHVDTEAATDDSERRKILIEHFVKSANPISVILPTHSEWTSACRSLLAMANESAFLLSAICALSALHMYATRGEDSSEEALRHYRASSRDVNAVMDLEDVDDRLLKQAFATVFLLTHVEILAQTTPQAKQNGWPLQYLQTTHHRVRQHSDRIRLWTGINKRLLTWMALLQTKAEYNSGNCALQHSSAPLSKSTGDPFTRTPSNVTAADSLKIALNTEHSRDANGDVASAESEEDTRTMAELAYDTLNQPGFDFFLKSQAFTSRIINLDRYHRQRGTLETEFEILKDGQQINADLHALWATRPTTMAFLRDPRALEQALEPKLARRLLLNLRVYVANFYALFIYLHRCAFKTYPATKDVDNAVARIINLATDILGDAQTPRQSQLRSPTSNPAPQHDRSVSVALSEEAERSGIGLETQESDLDTGLPATMLWPLFLAAIECGAPDRERVCTTLMREMDKRHVRNAARTVLLLEEVLRRQDQECRRVDHRSVRQDLFEGELSVLY